MTDRHRLRAALHLLCQANNDAPLENMQRAVGDLAKRIATLHPFDLEAVNEFDRRLKDKRPV